MAEIQCGRMGGSKEPVRGVTEWQRTLSYKGFLSVDVDLHDSIVLRKIGEGRAITSGWMRCWPVLPAVAYTKATGLVNMTWPSVPKDHCRLFFQMAF